MAKLATFLKFTKKEIESCRERFEKGDAAALLDALFHCARREMLPPWVAQAFCDRLDDWRCYRTATLDEAFKVKRKKGRKTSLLAQREGIAALVIARINELCDTGKVKYVKDAIAQAAAESGISIRKARRIYYELTELVANSQQLPR
jgi:hypothetical protein